MAGEFTVRLGECAFGDGEITVPAGARIVIVQGWRSKNKGLVQSFLRGQTTTISIDGGAPVDLSNSYSSIHQTDVGGFETLLRFDTGVSLSAGESVQVDSALTLSHVVPEGLLDETTHRQMFNSPGEHTMHCRITASA
jgi:hypothetical protein